MIDLFTIFVAILIGVFFYAIGKFTHSDIVEAMGFVLVIGSVFYFIMGSVGVF